jgi:hypothetical protein
MRRVSLIDVHENESKEDVLWHNLKQADSIYNLGLFIASSMAYFEQYPNKNFEDLEMELRQRDFNTHLIANVVDEEAELRFIYKKSDHIKKGVEAKKALYEIIYSCRPKEHAVKEVLMHWKTYEENLEKLKYSGMRCVSEKEDAATVEDIKCKDFRKFTTGERDNNEELAKCKKKIVIKNGITLEDIVEDIKQKYGKPPEERVVAIDLECNPVYGFFMGSEMVTNVGFIKNKKGETKLVGLN